MGSSIGRLFRVTTFGESHGAAIGGVVEGCPPGIAISAEDIQVELDRRRPGGRLSSPRKEQDRVEILSGVLDGVTLGTAIGLLIGNRDADSRAYEPLASLYRPSHADYTYDARYGRRDWRGGGRASARETAIRVAAGAIARQVLAVRAGVEIVGWVEQVGGIVAGLDPDSVSRDAVEASEVRCPDPIRSAEMVALIEEVRRQKDTVGGVVRCVARGVPAGLGDPVFDKLEAELAKACMSLPAAKGFSSGTGFAAAAMRGSQHNDPFVPGPHGPRTTTNHSGGIQGGISNGMPVLVSVAFKPVATIFQPQQTVDVDGNPAVIEPRGRHDPCVVARAVPIVEAAVAMTLCDHLLRYQAIRQ